MVKIGLIGDVHLDFGADDVTFFNEAGYDLLLFVGDLGNYGLGEMLACARQLSRLTTPALLLPGNHDAVTFVQLMAEVKGWSWLAGVAGGRMEAQVAALKTAVSPVQCVGYSRHAFRLPTLAFDVVAARPHAMGGSRLNYAAYLKRQFGIGSMAESARRLCQLVDEAESDALIFLAHNGPLGLGAEANAIWGCDFDPKRGDFGDGDLQEAIGHAQATGKRVLAVVAGHMHEALKLGGRRQMRLVREEVLYLNAAVVPRIVAGENGRFRHHHWLLRLDGERVVAEEKWIAGGGAD